MVTKNINIWNICVIFVTSNNPPCKPIPLVTILKEDISCKIQYIKIKIPILLNRIDKSRLILTALLSKTNSKDDIIIPDMMNK